MLDDTFNYLISALSVLHSNMWVHIFLLKKKSVDADKWGKTEAFEQQTFIFSYNYQGPSDNNNNNNNNADIDQSKKNVNNHKQFFLFFGVNLLSLIFQKGPEASLATILTLNANC